MGYLVSCAVSRLGINFKERVVLIPLLPYSYSLRSEFPDHLIEPQSYVSMQNQYFNPFCLPIEGLYNDYGGLESIEEDANTKAIEAFTGVTIQELVDSISFQAVYSSDDWNLHTRFVRKHKLIAKDPEVINHDFMVLMGFTKIAEARYSYKNLDLEVQLSSPKSPTAYLVYELFNKQGTSLKHSPHGHHRLKEEFLDTVQKLTKYYIGVEDKDQGRVDLIMNLSAMFVKKEIYEHLVQTASQTGSPASKIDASKSFDDLQAQVLKFKEVASWPKYMRQDYARDHLEFANVCLHLRNPLTENSSDVENLREMLYLEELYQDAVAQGTVKNSGQILSQQLFQWCS